MKSIKLHFRKSNRIYVLYGLIFLMNIQMLTNILPFGFRISTVVPNAIITIFSFYFLLKRKYMNAVDISVCVYIIVSVLSLVFYLNPHNPVDITASAYGLNISVAPAMIYFVARALPSEDIPKTLSRFVIFNCFLLIIFVVLHVVRPDFYFTYLQSALASRGAVEEWQLFGRLQGYLGSTAVGVICVVSIFILGGIGKSRPYDDALLFVFLMAAFLTLQRSSMVLSVFGLVWILYNRSAIKSMVTLSFGVAALFLLTTKVGIDIALLERIADKVFEVKDAISYSERVSYTTIWAVIEQYPFGMGLGATTSAVDSAGLNPGGQLVDANHIRILADTGLLGLAAFLSSFIVIVIRVFRKPTIFNWSLFFVLLAMQVQATGTNVFDSYYVVHIYWVVMGFLSTSSVQRASLFDSRKHITFERAC